MERVLAVAPGQQGIQGSAGPFATLLPILGSWCSMATRAASGEPILMSQMGPGEIKPPGSRTVIAFELAKGIEGRFSPEAGPLTQAGIVIRYSPDCVLRPPTVK